MGVKLPALSYADSQAALFRGIDYELVPKVRQVLWKYKLYGCESTYPLKTHSMFTLLHVLWDFVCTEV